MMPDLKVVHIPVQSFTEFEVSSREPMQISIAFLGVVPETGDASIGIQIRYAGDKEKEA